MKTYAFIFARGGSKGLPGKNIKKLNGQDVYHYCLTTHQTYLLFL
jgi:N-acylneuraminate cytidylyltransferase